MRYILTQPSVTTADTYVRSEVSYTQYGQPSAEFGIALPDSTTIRVWDSGVREGNSKDNPTPGAADRAPRGDFRSRFDVLQSIDSAKTAAPSATAVMGSIFTSDGTPISAQT